ncbi:nucleotidyl transferase AbiEii/AbiGii toxin family protein [Pinirhizobacter soli]|uniref:nucleotidyl transferase AbiEii/AbiGii toxin family protein n=1 Tax=Pinirhizobacter soli TaxID=2786953 RepID=UPI002029E8EA|nr:nucleotidyl transferase AbiEii/AbiGii toxin family protein [Pinirhizobacter soli]
MFSRLHHQQIHKVLSSLNSALLSEAKCYFGGGTAIALLLGEYRESVDIDFLCSDRDGYRLLRNALAPPKLGKVVTTSVTYLREVRMQRDKVSTLLDVEGAKIRLEFVLEGRIEISGEDNAALGVPVLSRSDMYAEKLLANADRGLDRSAAARDMIDLAMMIDAWGPIPQVSVDKVDAVYGESIYRSFDQVLGTLQIGDYLSECLKAMKMGEQTGPHILKVLENNKPKRAKRRI